MNYIKTFLLIIGCLCGVAEAAQFDLYICPKLTNKAGVLIDAEGIGLFNEHPSKLYALKPDNDEETELGNAYWSMVPEEEYWYVCEYDNRAFKYEAKLQRKYKKCTNTGTKIKQNLLKCN